MRDDDESFARCPRPYGTRVLKSPREFDCIFHLLRPPLQMKTSARERETERKRVKVVTYVRTGTSINVVIIITPANVHREEEIVASAVCRSYSRIPPSCAMLILMDGDGDDDDDDICRVGKANDSTYFLVEERPS